MSCDFHLHSEISDGTLAPARVVEEAAGCGVAALALTDHDDVAGVPEAQERGCKLGVEVLPGIELSVGEQDGRVQLHILGLGIDVENAALLALVERLRAARLSRAAGIVQRLDALGISLDLEALRARRGSRALGRPHIAEALVACGVCSSVDAAFGRYLARGRPAYLPSAGTSPSSAIRHIHEAGGVAGPLRLSSPDDGAAASALL